MELQTKERLIFIISAENRNKNTSDDFWNWIGNENTDKKPLYVNIITRPDILGFIFKTNPITEKDHEKIKNTKF